MKDYKGIFIYSLRLPERQAAFKLNRIGMDKIIIYLFFLLGIASIPGLVDQMSTNVETSAYYMQSLFLLIFFFMFYYLILVSFIFAILSLIAYIGIWIAHWTSRKLRYSILWKMAACIMTIPILLFTAITFFYPLSSLFLVLVLSFHLFVFVQTIFLYPKRRRKTKH